MAGLASCRLPVISLGLSLLMWLVFFPCVTSSLLCSVALVRCGGCAPTLPVFSSYVCTQKLRRYWGLVSVGPVAVSLKVVVLMSVVLGQGGLLLALPKHTGLLYGVCSMSAHCRVFYLLFALGHYNKPIRMVRCSPVTALCPYSCALISALALGLGPGLWH